VRHAAHVTEEREGLRVIGAVPYGRFGQDQRALEIGGAEQRNFRTHRQHRRALGAATKGAVHVAARVPAISQRMAREPRPSQVREQMGRGGLRFGIVRVQRERLLDVRHGPMQRLLEWLLVHHFGARAHQRGPGVAWRVTHRSGTRRLGDDEPRHQPPDRLVQDPVAQRELAVGGGLDLVSPDMQSGAPVDQPHVAPQRPTGAKDASLDQIANAELRSDQPDIHRHITIGHGGMPRANEQPGEASERRRGLLSDDVSERATRQVRGFRQTIETA
jgi:hypothetical protein